MITISKEIEEHINNIALDYLYAHGNFPKEISYKNKKFKREFFISTYNAVISCVIYEEVNEYKEKNMMGKLNVIILLEHIAVIKPKLKNKNDRSYYRRSSHKI